MRLLLVRHGQTPNNVRGALDTEIPGARLTALGEAQADAIPAALSGYDVAAVYATRKVRTQLTATPLARTRGLEVHVRPGLEEISAGALTMRSDAQSVGAYGETLVAWMHGDLGRPMPGGPDGHAFLERYDAAVGAIVAEHGPDDTAVVVSHGAAIRVWTALSAGLDGQTAADLTIKNTGMGVLEGDPESGWELALWHSGPLGGAHLADGGAHDVTGESAEDAAQEPTPDS
ncbi:histidine phosphatase family protein [Ornithinimicrobium pekingense]|uniref:Fructose 1,6-bisphosphatase n=1 Tax=Ornithinimicrobium pekingense TaxID=384677 RepID=A0ABQ2F833_9MICO|nr:histidine phosphatase family protein [Ornithinimicrobium pekingense]GGK67981.1 fructose 1,6-bisphosphatase [Ornithinimicrobium pekingense]